jgi:hypothetical protein
MGVCGGAWGAVRWVVSIVGSQFNRIVIRRHRFVKIVVKPEGANGFFNKKEFPAQCLSLRGFLFHRSSFV